MARAHGFACMGLAVIILTAPPSSCSAGCGWARRIADAKAVGKEELHEAIRKNEHKKAKELIGARDERLATVLADFEASGECQLSEKEAIAIVESYELLWRWEEAQEIASQFVVDHPMSERAYMALFRCLLNLERLDEAVALLNEVEDRFPEHSGVRFVHSMLASKYQARKNWKMALHHSEIAAARRISVLPTRPQIAAWALFDFRRLAEAAIAMNAKRLEQIG